MKMLSRSLFLAVLTLALAFSSTSFAEEQKGVKIENGMISFLEEDTPGLDLKDLKFSFAPDSPAEIKAIQGKIYGSGVDRKGQSIYLIPLEYDSAIKAIKLLYVTNNKGTQYKPTKMTIEGTFKGLEGNSVKAVGDKSDKPWASFYVVPAEKGYNLRLLFASNGSVVNLRPMAELTAIPNNQNTASPPPKKNTVTKEMQDKVQWALGTWKGFMKGKGDWTLDVKEIDKMSTTDGKDSIDIKGSFRYREDKPSNMVIRMTDEKMIFKAWGKEDYVLSRATDTRMEGMQKRSDGKEYEIRFWKLGKEGIGTDNAKNSPLFGVWEGFWNPGSKGRYTIEYADNAAATILYEWSSDGWEWQNVSILPNGEFRVGPDNKYMVYRLSKDKKYLEGELFVSGEKTSSISAEKKLQESERLLKPRSLSSTVANTTFSQPVPPELRWAIGKWKGFQHWTKNVWTLEIVEKDGKLNGSFMLVTDKSKMYPILISASGNTLVFQSSSKEEFILNRVSDNRMDGKYTNTNRQERMVRFWKEGGVNANPLVGVWEGIWDVGQKARFAVEQIDATAATVRFDWGAYGETNKGGWNWENATVTGSDELRIENPDTMIVTILNLSKDRKSLKAEYLRSGNTVCTASLNKIDPNAQPLTNRQDLPKELSAFLGTWEGPWNDGTKLQLVVEKINHNEAEVVYITEDSPYWGKGRQNRYTAIVNAKEATIKWGRGNELVFAINKDLDSVVMTIYYYPQGGSRSTTMKRKK